MKSEERHELKENALQSWFQYGLPIFIKNNGSYFLLAAALCLLGWTLWRKHEQSLVTTAETASRELSEAQNPNVDRAMKLQSIIEQYDVKSVKALALRDLGNYYLSTLSGGTTGQSATAQVTNPEEALSKAQAAYERVINEFPDQLLAVGPSRLGLGTIAEDKGDWDGARKIYETLANAKTSYGPAVASTAKRRLDSLDARKNAKPLASLAPPVISNSTPKIELNPESLRMPESPPIIPPSSTPSK